MQPRSSTSLTTTASRTHRPIHLPTAARIAASTGLLALAACASSPAPAPQKAGDPAPTSVSAAQSSSTVPPAGLMAPHEGPTLFLGAEDGAPAIGYTAPDLPVEPAEPPTNGRVLVRIDGPLRVRAHAPVELVVSKVQRRGRIRDTPVYVGPGDRVHVMGPADEPGRLLVQARARLANGWSTPYAGSYPTVGLAPSDPPADARQPAEGTPYVLAAGKPLTLYDKPGGSVVAGLPASEQPIGMTVLRSDGGWHAVRVGEGPYLIGYTNDPIAPGEGPAATPEPTAPLADGPIPGRIARETGTLKRVRAGAKLRFNGEIIAVFKQDGWARVLAEYPGGQVDVFAAADDAVAVRGLVEAANLYDAE